MTNQYLSTLLAFPLVAAMAFAQTPKTQALLMAMGANGKQIAAYQWKQKTTFVRKGNPAGFKVDQVRVDSNGQLQRLTIGQSEEKRLGPIASRKAADIKSDIQEVMQLAGRYANPMELSQAIRKAEIWEGQGALRVQARSLILPIDEMTMTVNATSYLATRVDIKTQHEGNPVTIAIDYQQLPNGPSMMTRMTVQIPKEDIVVNVESFDFLRLTATVLP